MSAPRVLFTYWGRRGPISNLALELGRAAQRSPGIDAYVSVSRQNEIFDRFKQLGPRLQPAETFGRGAGAAALWRAFAIRQQLAALVQRERIDAVFELMPHVWSPLAMPAVRRAGARYITVVHDAQAHPGDPTSAANVIMNLCVPLADHVVTLSQAVAKRLIDAGRAPAAKITTLFHPDLTLVSEPAVRARRPGAPVRLLFLGRILPYKGLPLFLDAVEALRRRGEAVEFGVFGEGSVGAEATRIERLGGELVNRWLGDDEIAAILPRFDAVMLSHTEASQSGVAAVAFGAGLPIVTTPVGGLTEQVQDGATGIVAARVDGEALADATQRLFSEGSYDAITTRIRIGSGERSVERFLREVAVLAQREPAAA
ncbi:hypothetical protein GCM10007036_15480 [Alsobacter metallidurans]|uniref:Glycosyltransferase subfamily 4-like N-terminal domain-containing protein n=1 Tax=Alsobacter metallidurans TaxID=340221 RepID=A0A917MGJ6_9HYPH|nr:glycosyltransferase family 4 protein [Alsobacter metallidurans]GGH15460.1 hypothetical protein GCM10007036_15480 [Alsobacter metallidurans]